MVSTPIKIFCSYAHEDEAWLRELEIHLSPLKKQGFISLWHDHLITAGTDWSHALDQNLEAASVILLLVSAYFFASDYRTGIEMKRALERQKAGEAVVIPILVREFDWKDAPFAHLHVLPTNAKPLTSWQDKDTALAEVAKGIRRAIEHMTDLSAKALPRTFPPIWNIPYRRNMFFTGREDLLARVHTHLQSGQSMAISQYPQALSGLGGIGKTQLAVEYAYRFGHEYEAILWVYAESRETFYASYTSLAAHLDLPAQASQNQEIMVQAVKRWLQTHTGWLLILDNADDLLLVQEFLPPTIGGHLLLTTRARAMKGVAKRIEVEVFSAEQSALFLLRRAGLLPPDAPFEQAKLEDQEQALHIAHDLGGLPLALDQVGAYLEETEESPRQYWQLYQQHRSKLLRERRGLGIDHPDPVVTTWSLSLQRIQKKSPVAVDLLHFCAFLSPDAIPEDVLTKGAAVLGPILSPVSTDTLLFNQAIEMILAYSLMQRDPQEKSLSMHRLVQAVIQDEMTNEEKQCWVQRAILAVNSAFPESGTTTRRYSQYLLPQALSVTQLIDTYQVDMEEARSLLLKVAQYLFDCVRSREVEPFLQRVLHIYEQQLGRDHLETTTILDNLALLYMDEWRFEEAEQILQRLEQQLGSNHPDVVHTLNLRGIFYKRQSKYEEAESFYTQAIHICEQQLGQKDFAQWHIYNNLGVLYIEQRRFEEAETLLSPALQMEEQQLGVDNYSVVALLGNLMRAYIGLNKYVEAEPLYQRLIRFWDNEQQPVGDEHYRILAIILGLAELYAEKGKYVEAESLYQRAIRFIEIWEKQSGEVSFNLVYSFTDLIILYTNQGKYEQAEPLAEQALYICEQIVGSESSEVVTYMINLAIVYREQKKYEQAELLFERALHIQEQMVGSESSEVASLFYELAYLSYIQGRYEQAKPLFERAIFLGCNWPDAHLYQGYVNLHLHKKEQACQSFVTYATLLPENVNAAWMVIWSRFGKPPPGSEIAEHLEKIALLDPKSDEACTCRGVALGLQGKYQEGLVELERALQLDANGQDAYFWKGILCAYLGENTAAMGALEQALQHGLPPVLLTPLFWLEQEKPLFYQEFAEPFLKQHRIL